MAARRPCGSRCLSGSMTSIDPYGVGADSISARKACHCRRRPRATNGRPYKTKAHPAHSCRMSCGWVGEVRTHECGSQSPVPYHLATTHYTAARGGAFVKKKRPRRNGPERSLVGCLERFELSASRATIWRANQLRHRHHIMRPKGLEPPAHCLEGSCSIQLSYGRLLRVHVREGHTA